METRAKGIDSWLKDEHSDNNVLAICGMGGSGKTTLAQYIYNSNKHNFEGSSFLEEIGKHFKETCSLLGLGKKLLEDILGSKNNMISCVAECTTKIKEVLQKKKVLIVLDDIDEHEELCVLLGTTAVDTQSKIIVTSRLLNIQSWFESISWRCCVHQLTLLNDHESLELLSCHAFGSRLPAKGFRNLAIELAQYCGGNPLALKVLGSSLYVSAEDPREKNSIKEIWRSRLNSLCSLKDLDSRIQVVLQKSFDSLPLASNKELFLHIALFFVGNDEDYVVKILEHDWHAKVGIMTLINRCLLTVSSKKKLMMHQLLQEMGRNIVRDESKDPAKHTRVWCSDEAYHVLTRGDGLETIEGLSLDIRKLKKGTKALAIKTGSLAKMHKLKLLKLNYVKVNGCYKNFPELRWLCWHGCHLKTIPLGLLTSRFLVAIDMTRGKLKTFEPPMVIYSLKILNLTNCMNLISIRKLDRLPNLETLILWCCINLTHICKTIGGLESLSLLNLTGCGKLFKASLNSIVKQQGILKALCIEERIWKKPLFSLPRSLKFLFLNECNLEHHHDLPIAFSDELFGMSLTSNMFEFIPNNINLKMLRVLNLNFCENLKSILCLPSTLEELYIHGCISLEKVTFQSARFRLRKFGYSGCYKLFDVQGLFKLVAIEKHDEADLGHMKWIKEYQDDKVELVGEGFIEGGMCNIQMLYEYGIWSTYLQGIKDHIMMAFNYTSANEYLIFRVPLHPNKFTIQGLHVSCLYRSTESKDKDRWLLFIIISNITKDATWIYNPVVYCKPKVDEDAMWLSYWPLRNMLDIGDVIYVSLMVQKGMVVSKCGAHLEYMDAAKVVTEENVENKTNKMEEVIGGDLSEFQLTPGVYYLCRRDFFKLAAPDVIKGWFGDSVPYSELQGWRKAYQSQYFFASCMHLEYIEELHEDILYKGIYLSVFNDESDILKIKMMVYKLVEVEHVHYFKEKKLLLVLGCVDSKAVETFVRKFEKTVKVVAVNYNAKRLRKRYHMNNVMWGPNFITAKN